MAVTVDQQRTASGRRIHADNFIRRRGAVGHHVALLGAKGASDILFRFQMRAGMVQQRPQFGNRDRNIGFQRITAEEIIKQAADRAFLVGGSRHVSGSAKGIFPLLHIVK